MKRRTVLWMAGGALACGALSPSTVGGRALIGWLTGEDRRRREFTASMAAQAQDIGWLDLAPQADGGPVMRRLDGSAPSGIVQHGDITVRTGAAGSDKPGLDREELVRRLGGTRSFDAPPRRFSDAMGGLGNLKGLQPRGGKSRPDMDGRIVRLSGFVLALRFEDRALLDFLLVPYVGACSHVPPPPANQIVFVTDARDMDVSDGQFRPVRVTGLLETVAADTELALAGYRMTDPVIERVG